MSTACVFVYGSLRDEQLVESLIGRRLPSAPARLHGYRCVTPPDSYPFLIADPGSVVDGQILRGADASVLDAFDRYEVEGSLYRRITVEVDLEGGVRVPAFTYAGIEGAHPVKRE